MQSRKTVRRFLFPAALFLLGALSFCCLFFAPRQSFALESHDVSTSFAATYDVNTHNEADVEIDVTFENIGENPAILTQYDLNIGNFRPVDVSVTRGNTTLSHQVLEDRGSVIRMNLNDQLLRVGDTQDVAVKFKISRFLYESGGAYEVELPLFQYGGVNATESMQVVYPETFGHIAYTNLAFDASSENGFMQVIYKEFADAERLFLSIADQKTYSYYTERNLKNSESQYVQQEIIIPPDTDSQDLVLSSISPYPDSVYLSDEGNYILVYNVAPSDDVWVRVQGILIEENVQGVDYHISPDEVSEIKDLDVTWWRITDEKILADIASVDDGALTENKVDWIYDYTLENLVLSDNFRDLHEHEYRKGAEIALKTYKNASAEDYADVFVALSWKLGIPARIVAGYVFPYSVGGSDLGMFHVWPQYWSNEYGWVSIDPAYEAYNGEPLGQKVGVNRVVLAVSHGTLDYSGFSDTTDEVHITDETAELVGGVEAELTLPSKINAGKSSSGTVKIKNTGNTVLSRLVVTPADGDLDVEFDPGYESMVILPGETVQVTFDVKASTWHYTGDQDLSFSIVAESSAGTQRAEVDDNVVVEMLPWIQPVTWLITGMLFLLLLGIFVLAVKVVQKLLRKSGKGSSIDRKVIDKQTEEDLKMVMGSRSPDKVRSEN